MLTARIIKENGYHTTINVFLKQQCIGQLVVESEDAVFIIATLTSTPRSGLCPRELQESLLRKCEPTGDFLAAVLNNDLNEAIHRADFNNIHLLRHIVAFMEAKL